MNSTKNQTFETSWSRLETALNEDSYFYTMNDIRPKTTASSRRYSPCLQKAQRLGHFIQSTSIAKSFAGRVNRPATANSLQARPVYLVPGLTQAQLQAVYTAKCLDLGIPVLNDQEKRFVAACIQNFAGRSFALKDAGLGCRSAKVIGDVLKKSEYFAYVDLSKNMLKDSGAAKLAKRIAGSASIVHLDLSSNELSPEGCGVLLSILECHTSLASLDISSHEGLHRNRLAVLGSQSVSRLLKNAPVLCVLNLAGTGIGNDGLEFLIEGLEGNVRLSSLNLSNNSISGKVVERLSQSLSKTDLRDLNLSNNKISNEGCEFIAMMLSGGYSGYPMIAKLNISSNEITTPGIGKLLAALRINNQVTHLFLKKNDFSRGLSSHLNPFLYENIALKLLDFSHCGITTEGISGLSEGLAKNNGLTHLNFSYNFFEDKGAEAIATALYKNNNLKHIDLSGNKIKDKGGVALTRAVLENESLEVLKLKNNSLKDDTGMKFAELSRWKRNILKLSLELNPMNLKYLDVIKDNIKYNHEYQKKMMVPKLQEIVNKLQYKESILDEVYSKISQKQKEREDLSMKIKSKEVKFEEIKASEDAKFKELKDEYLQLRAISEKFAVEIEESNHEITVTVK